jgi:hypothetical protein
MIVTIYCTSYTARPCKGAYMYMDGWVSGALQYPREISTAYLVQDFTDWIEVLYSGSG